MQSVLRDCSAGVGQHVWFSANTGFTGGTHLCEWCREAWFSSSRMSGVSSIEQHHCTRRLPLGCGLDLRQGGWAGLGKEEPLLQEKRSLHHSPAWFRRDGGQCGLWGQPAASQTSQGQQHSSQHKCQWNRPACQVPSREITSPLWHLGLVWWSGRHTGLPFQLGPGAPLPFLPPCQLNTWLDHQRAQKGFWPWP